MQTKKKREKKKKMPIGTLNRHLEHSRRLEIATTQGDFIHPNKSIHICSGIIL